MMTVIHSTTLFLVLAGTSVVGPSTTTSGSINQPSDHLTGGGASRGSPSGAPSSAHLAMASISLCFRERSFRSDDAVGFDQPAFGPFDWWRRIARVALRSTFVSPSRNGLNLALFQGTVVQVRTVLRVGEPWWHLAARHGRLHSPRPGTNILIGQERHWRHLPGPVARLTISLQDGFDVLMEGCRRCLRAQRRNCHCRSRQNHASKHRWTSDSVVPNCRSGLVWADVCRTSRARYKLER